MVTRSGDWTQKNWVISPNCFM